MKLSDRMINLTDQRIKLSDYCINLTEKNCSDVNTYYNHKSNKCPSNKGPLLDLWL